jgi:hypothetical protein
MRDASPVPAADWKKWAEAMRRWADRTRSKLLTFLDGDSAAEDGVLLWDREGYPVVSKGGEWRQVVLADGGAMYAVTSTTTAASTNTAYPIEWDSTSFEFGISLHDTDDSKIVVEEAGYYLVNFSVELESNSGSAKEGYFWPRINGTDVTGSTIHVSLSRSGDALVMARTAFFQMSAGDELQAMWAVSSTALHMNAMSATAFCPASPAATISLTRVRQ